MSEERIIKQWLIFADFFLPSQLLFQELFKYAILDHLFSPENTEDTIQKQWWWIIIRLLTHYTSDYWADLIYLITQKCSRGNSSRYDSSRRACVL